jgi:hypothetical protein
LKVKLGAQGRKKARKIFAEISGEERKGKEERGHKSSEDIGGRKV